MEEVIAEEDGLCEIDVGEVCCVFEGVAAQVCAGGWSDALCAGDGLAVVPAVDVGRVRAEQRQIQQSCKGGYLRGAIGGASLCLLLR